MSEEKNRHEARRWLDQAKADLRAADGSVRSGSCEWACFQSQQAGEKALKALWFAHGGDPWGHSLVRLVQDYPGAALRELLAEVQDQAKALDKHYISTRYPNGLPDLTPAEVFTADEARQAIRAAGDIIRAVERLMLEDI